MTETPHTDIEFHRKSIRMLAAEYGGGAVVNGVISHVIQANRPKMLLGRVASIAAHVFFVTQSVVDAGTCINLFRLVNTMEYGETQTAWTFPVATALRGPVDLHNANDEYACTEKPVWASRIWPANHLYRTTDELIASEMSYMHASKNN